ncbi:fumarylacetoacetate hydrolase family protein [Pseudomonas sp. FP597]|uniref:fumarylacetoacetate hydrolase family protein n=1 Tax=Pseudomonas sp. FP597 TaxID=2954096 RepID=UPI0027373741|nr:fumarylacetoacetate hydrolase family protein [Pseudomonas sp. FP597]WLI04524.1 fumarylacetoacetate hydrolase family protein [Pseudomonas sp. FP597]
MKLATLADGSRDGRLLIVSRDLKRAVEAPDIAATLQSALDNWGVAEPQLHRLYASLNRNEAAMAFDLDLERLAAPLPRAWQWLDGSCFLSHGELMQKAFNLEPIEGVDSIPLMYQGVSDDFIGPRADIPLPSEAHCIDFEGEFAILVDEVPMGCSAEEALHHIRLILQLNDVSLRALAPREMKTGFGFIQAKPTTSFAPVAVTPDELGDAWRTGRVHLPLNVEWNGNWFGHPHGCAMHFGFHQLIAHAALTRKLSAGSLIGSGTVSNSDRSVGSACIAERRAIEIIADGVPKTDFMRFGDRVRMEARAENGDVLFGAIDQQLVQGGISCA